MLVAQRWRLHLGSDPLASLVEPQSAHCGRFHRYPWPKFAENWSMDSLSRFTRSFQSKLYLCGAFFMCPLPASWSDASLRPPPRPRVLYTITSHNSSTLLQNQRILVPSKTKPRSLDWSRSGASRSPQPVPRPNKETPIAGVPLRLPPSRQRSLGTLHI
jgi:hypothetical protein